MSSSDSTDIYFKILCQAYSENEVSEIQRYTEGWSRGTYTSVAQSVLDHAERKGIEPIKYLRQAYNFSKKGARRVPSKGYRKDGSAVYRKSGQYLIVRLNSEGVEKIVSFGIS